MKVLFIGHYRENSGWGQAAKDYLLSLSRAGVDVVARPFNLGLAGEVSEEIQALEHKSDQDCTHCIQALLPHNMEYDGRFEKCIGIYIPDTRRIADAPINWYDKLNSMDEVWVTHSGSELVNDNQTVVPIPCDLETIKPEGRLNIQELEGNFSFYFIGEANRRKHLSALIRAFNQEFDRNEPVKLVIKSGKPGMSPEDSASELRNMFNTIKSKMGLYPSVDHYIEEVLITEHLPFEQLLGLHETCDCFVMPSFGEGWCIPAFHAMYLGKIPIVSDTGGMREYIDGMSGFRVKGNIEPVLGYDCAVPSLGTSRESWFNIDQYDLMRLMRKVYDLHLDRDPLILKMKEYSKVKAEEYSYKTVGEQMKRCLSE